MPALWTVISSATKTPCVLLPVEPGLERTVCPIACGAKPKMDHVSYCLWSQA